MLSTVVNCEDVNPAMFKKVWKRGCLQQNHFIRRGAKHGRSDRHREEP